MQGYPQCIAFALFCITKERIYLFLMDKQFFEGVVSGFRILYAFDDFNEVPPTTDVGSSLGNSCVF